MKTLKKPTVLFLLGMLLSTISYSQVIVSNKLSAPEKEITQKQPNRTQIWISGEWVISNNQYTWEKGHWIEKRPGYIFMPGYWKKVKGGWTWVSGSWKAINMKQWNNVYA